MANLYQYEGKWVTADKLRQLREGNKKQEIKEENKPNDLVELRAKYKELHPEGKSCPPAWLNNEEKLQEKIAEFTK